MHGELRAVETCSRTAKAGVSIASLVQRPSEKADAASLLLTSAHDSAARLAAQTPESVRAVLGKWLTRPVYGLTVEPGARDAYAEAVVAGVVNTQEAAKARLEAFAKGTAAKVKPE